MRFGILALALITAHLAWGQGSQPLADRLANTAWEGTFGPDSSVPVAAGGIRLIFLDKLDGNVLPYFHRVNGAVESKILGVDKACPGIPRMLSINPQQESLGQISVSAVSLVGDQCTKLPTPAEIPVSDILLKEDGTLSLVAHFVEAHSVDTRVRYQLHPVTPPPFDLNAWIFGPM